MRRSNIIALLVFLAILAGIFLFSPEMVGRVHAIAQGFFSPAVRASATLDEKIKGVQPVENPQRLLEENRELKRKAAESESYKRIYEELKTENDELRKVLDYKKKSALNLLPARVIKRSTANWWQTLTIDKGESDGVRREMPVITVEGLVGKTAESWAHESKVILLTDEACRVSATIEGTNARGIVQGQRGNFATQTDLRMRYLDKNLQLAPGALVKTLGVGGVFDSGIPIGRLKIYTEKDLGAEAVIDPTVHFEDILDVLVVVKKESPE